MLFEKVIPFLGSDPKTINNRKQKDFKMEIFIFPVFIMKKSQKQYKISLTIMQFGACLYINQMVWSSH